MVERLLAAGHGVRELDALLPEVHAVPPDLPAAAELVTADVRNAGAVAAALREVGMDERSMAGAWPARW